MSTFFCRFGNPVASAGEFEQGLRCRRQCVSGPAVSHRIPEIFSKVNISIASMRYGKTMFEVESNGVRPCLGRFTNYLTAPDLPGMRQQGLKNRPANALSSQLTGNGHPHNPHHAFTFVQHTTSSDQFRIAQGQQEDPARKTRFDVVQIGVLRRIKYAPVLFHSGKDQRPCSLLPLRT